MFCLINNVLGEWPLFTAGGGGISKIAQNSKGAHSTIANYTTVTLKKVHPSIPSHIPWS